MKKRSHSITLRGADANAFIASATGDKEMSSAVEKTAPGSPARKSIIAEILVRKLKIPGVCSVCGCTEDDCRKCIEKTGMPCHWVDEKRILCSACAGRERVFIFKWFGWGEKHWDQVTAPDHPIACYGLGILHGAQFLKRGLPEDFKMDLMDYEESL